MSKHLPVRAMDIVQLAVPSVNLFPFILYMLSSLIVYRITTSLALRIGKTGKADAKLRRIVNQYGVPPASARNLQAAIVQGTMLYALELTWNSQDKVEGLFQLAINRMARATLGVQPSTPRGIIMAESGFAPARALLDHRRDRFAQRLYARTQGGQGPEEILERESTLTARLKEAARVERRGGSAEEQE